MYVEGVVSGEVKVSRLAFSTLLVWRHCDTTTFSVHIPCPCPLPCQATNPRLWVMSETFYVVNGGHPVNYPIYRLWIT
jgi:hypothetical protein